MENIDQILDAPEVAKTRLQYAGFWIRTGAYIIDAIIISAVGLFIGFLFGDFSGTTSAFSTVLQLIIGVGYFALMECSEYQATLGKMAVGIRVGDENGDRISFANAMGRYFAKIISALLLCVGFMMVGWDDKKQGMHDKLASTFVFYRPFGN